MLAELKGCGCVILMLALTGVMVGAAAVKVWEWIG